MIKSLSTRAKWSGRCTVVSCIMLWTPVLWPLSFLKSKDVLALASAVLKCVKYRTRCLIWPQESTITSDLNFHSDIQPAALPGRKYLSVGGPMLEHPAAPRQAGHQHYAQLICKHRGGFWDTWGQHQAHMMLLAIRNLKRYWTTTTTSCFIFRQFFSGECVTGKTISLVVTA